MSTELKTFNFEITSMDQAMQYAKLIADSDLAPKDYKGKPGNVLIAIQYGVEIGLKPMQAIQNIAVINGRPSIWGDAMIALVQNSPLCEYINEEIKGDTAYCTVKRKGEDEHVAKFSKEDAKKAGLFGKSGPWTQYPDRMLQLRARAFALRDKFSDVLKGMAMREEVMDYEVVDISDRQAKASAAQNRINTIIQLKKEPTINIPTIQDITSKIENATSINDLSDIPNMVTSLSEGDKELTRKMYKAKKLELEKKVETIDYQTGEVTETSKSLEFEGFTDFHKIRKQLLSAKSLDILNIAADLISSCAPENQEELTKIYNKRKEEIN